MGNKNITIHDISKALNIDSSTVSRALNNSDRVSKKTKEKIYLKAKELGYQKNTLASNLRKNKTFTIGVVIPRISRYFFAQVIAGIEEAAYEKGYNVVICQSLEEYEREVKIVDNLKANRVDGIIISTSMNTEVYEHLENFINDSHPIVFIDRPSKHFANCTNITIDNYKASYEATTHLIKHGRKNIAHFSGNQNVELYKQRKLGYIAALKDAGIPINESYIFETILSEKDGIETAKKIIALQKIDGIYCSNDTTAISAIKYFKSQGIAVPEDIAIVGVNNDPISEVIEPSLTTINQPGFQMGKISTESLIAQIENKQLVNNSIVLDSELIIRKSSKN